MSNPVTPDMDFSPLPMRTYSARGMVEGLYTPTPRDYQLMDAALFEGEMAGLGGDTPVGCTFLSPDGDSFSMQTREFRDNDLEAHAEKRAYSLIQHDAGRDLGGWTVYSNMEPCFGCAYMFDKGGLGMLVLAAEKADFPDFFRNPDTLDHIWSRTRRPLRVVAGLRKAKAIEIFTSFPKQH